MALEGAKIKFKWGTINVEEAQGEVFIYIDKDLVSRVNIVAKDSGVPGVVGPHIDIRLSDSVRSINDSATLAAINADWGFFGV